MSGLPSLPCSRTAPRAGAATRGTGWGAGTATMVTDVRVEPASVWSGVTRTPRAFVAPSEYTARASVQDAPGWSVTPAQPSVSTTTARVPTSSGCHVVAPYCWACVPVLVTVRVVRAVRPAAVSPARQGDVAVCR